jgi:hypothetical protein
MYLLQYQITDAALFEGNGETMCMVWTVGILAVALAGPRPTRYRSTPLRGGFAAAQSNQHFALR